MVYESRPNVTADAAASPWRAQLGAFGVDGNARKLWATLEKKNPAVAARQPYLVKSGKLTRLQAGGFANKAEADSFCAALRKDGQACLVVARSEEHTSELQSLMRISYAVFCLKQKKNTQIIT